MIIMINENSYNYMYDHSNNHKKDWLQINKNINGHDFKNCTSSLMQSLRWLFPLASHFVSTVFEFLWISRVRPSQKISTSIYGYL